MDTDKDWASIKLFCLSDDGNVGEHWDMLQVVRQESKNKNSICSLSIPQDWGSSVLSPNLALQPTAYGGG